MKRIVTFAIIALFIVPVLSHAQAVVEKGSFETSGAATIHENDYNGDLAKYFGLESVYVVQEFTVKYQCITNKNGFNCTSQWIGTAWIYDTDGGTLLNVRPLNVIFKYHFFDKNSFFKTIEKIPPMLVSCQVNNVG